MTGIIYIYRNNLNGKVYIGQTTQKLERRHSKHITASKTSDCRFYRAIRKYGINNFSLNILEENISIDEIDDREKFWIAKYGSADISKGYNMTVGGKLPFNKNQKLSNNDVAKIKNMLSDTNTPYSDIAKLFNVKECTIGDINLGRSFVELEREYPIRKNAKRTKIEKSDLENLISEIENTNISFQNLSNKYGIPKYTIEIINRGEHKKYSPKNKSFPLRKHVKNFTYSNKLFSEDIINIIKLYLIDNLSFKEISVMYNIAKNTISDITRGISWKEETKFFKFPMKYNKKENIEILKKVYGIV